MAKYKVLMNFIGTKEKKRRFEIDEIVEFSADRAEEIDAVGIQGHGGPFLELIEADEVKEEVVEKPKKAKAKPKSKKKGGVE
jgi:hypothetical protein